MDRWIYIGVVEEDGHFKHIQEAFLDEKSALEEQPQKIYATEDEAREWIRQEFLKAKAEDPFSDNESFIWDSGKDSNGLGWWSCGHAEYTLDWTVYELNLKGGQ